MLIRVLFSVSTSPCAGHLAPGCDQRPSTSTLRRAPTLSLAMPTPEWLPSSLGGGGGSSKPPSVMQQMGNRMTNAIQPARDNAQVAAGMVGVDVSNSNDNCYDACCPKLTFQERVYGCVGCFAIGLAVSFLGFMMWWSASAPPPPAAHCVVECMAPCRRALRPHCRAPPTGRPPIRPLTRSSHASNACAAGKIAMFATLYTLGNIISICGSGCAHGHRSERHSDVGVRCDHRHAHDAHARLGCTPRARNRRAAPHAIWANGHWLERLQFTPAGCSSHLRAVATAHASAR